MKKNKIACPIFKKISSYLVILLFFFFTFCNQLHIVVTFNRKVVAQVAR